jgi:two-component system OmpR family response regulator
MQVLIVEDDVRLADALSHILKDHKFMVNTVHDGKTGLDYAMSGIYDAIVLDVMLPRMNGFDVVSELRRNKIKTPVLMLTARDAVRDRVNGLDYGADDYMTKPFAPAELMARLRALTRRHGEVIFENLEVGDLKLDLDTCDLMSNDRTIHLGYKEFSIMKLLMINAQQVVSKDTIIAKVWGIESTADDNNVEAYISFLRKKLSFLDSDVRIETLRKVGYRLEPGTDD